MRSPSRSPLRRRVEGRLYNSSSFDWAQMSGYLAAEQLNFTRKKMSILFLRML